MTKRNRILYWVVTVFLAIGMLAGGIQQMLQIGGYNDIFIRLSYPFYLLTVIGVWKILGVIAILIPKYPLLKEWAYAGFFFVMSGAATSHLAVGQSITEAVPSLVLLGQRCCHGISDHQIEDQSFTKNKSHEPKCKLVF